MSLTNPTMCTMYRTMLTIQQLRKILWYSKTTGLFWWLETIGSNAQKGTRAGSLHSSGYVHIKIFGRLYKTHRLAWLYVTGEFPKLDVEHRNLRCADNRWCNLRLATDSQNQANVRTRIDNTSGFKGVILRKESGMWRAQMQFQKKRLSLGEFSTARKAHKAYMQKAKELFGEFARAR